MKLIALITLLSALLFSGEHIKRQWKKGMTFNEYLFTHHISQKRVRPVSKGDKKYLSDIRSQYPFYEELDSKGKLVRAFIPINKKMQIELYKSGKGYRYDITSIPVKIEEHFANIKVLSNLHSDIVKQTKSINLAEAVSKFLKHSFDTRRFKRGDRVYVVYDQKIREGEPFLSPQIKIVKIRSHKRSYYFYAKGEQKIQEQVYYENKKETVTQKKKVTYTKCIDEGGRSQTFGMPLRRIRITSTFSYRRWHPILHRYRPHHGTDFGARRGTPLYAVADGVVIYAGWMGGYGKVTKIRHSDGFVSLYAHQSRFRLKRGAQVKKGQIIGYVGSTGRSTGPHLHFGLSKNGRWVNPMHYLGKRSLKGKCKTKRFTKIVEEKKEIIKRIKKSKKATKTKDSKMLKTHIEGLIKSNTKTKVW